MGRFVIRMFRGWGGDGRVWGFEERKTWMVMIMSYEYNGSNAFGDRNASGGLYLSLTPFV